MYQTEQNTPIEPVVIEHLPDERYRVRLRKNITEEERTEDGYKYTVYKADETSFFTDDDISVEYATEHFDDLWYLGENGETWDEKYSRLVDKFIRERYSQSAVEALTFNYLKEPEKYKYEFDEFQKFREEVKERVRTNEM